jgi:two-component system sensor histidine kinase DesK
LIPVVVLLVLASLLAPRFVPGWGHQIAWNDALSVFLVTFAMFGFFMIIRNNIELSKARAEVARLAAENERSRIARDLHDLLGHSLTTITVKAGLARKLAERDPARAAEEITAVEQLTRRTLGEVRAAVAGYRDVTLAGELASAHEVLRASGIEAELPNAVDAVDADAVEVFGWVVREAVTNVVRHSRADRCTITVGPRWIEISDDGIGAQPSRSQGHGLRGLGERLDAMGGSITARGSSRGWTVRAELAPLDVPRTVDAR